MERYRLYQKFSRENTNHYAKKKEISKLQKACAKFGRKNVEEW